MRKAKEKKKVFTPRKKKVKVDMSILPPAIFEGRFIVKLKGRVVFERTLNGKTELHLGTVTSHDAEAGYVGLWDETREQCYGFDIANPPPIRAESSDDLVEPLEMIELKDDLLRTKLHLRFLEEKLGTLFMIVKDIPAEQKKAS